MARPRIVPRKLLVASVGVATLNYLGTACGGTVVEEKGQGTGGNAGAGTGGAAGAAQGGIGAANFVTPPPTSTVANLVAPPPTVANLVAPPPPTMQPPPFPTVANLMPPPPPPKIDAGKQHEDGGAVDGGSKDGAAE